MIKAMPKQKLKQKAIYYIRQIPLLILVAVFVLAFAAAPLVQADQFDEKINRINQDSSEKAAVRNQLGSEAASLSEKINKLQAQIDSLRAQINDYINDIKKLQRQIRIQEEELEKQKAILGENIKTMYLEGDITTLEMLASSRDLSEFVDKQQYRLAVQDKVTDTMNQIIDLKQQLKTKKDSILEKLEDKKAAQSQLNARQAENNEILSLNESQQANLNSKLQQNAARVAELRAQQFAANSRFIGGAGNGPACGGGYPAKWCEVPQDTVFDNWGMWNRECVSYTAFKVAASGRHMPHWGGNYSNGYQGGNANKWDD